MNVTPATFRFVGLAAEPFRDLFSLPDGELASRGARRQIADAKPGFPCRVSLEDAEPGEEVLLLNYEHQPAPTPFRAAHAIYVRRVAAGRYDRAGAVPPALRSRLLSIRAFDAAHFMVDADVAEGAEVEALIERLLARGDVAYLHVHFARRGCYAARVERA